MNLVHIKRLGPSLPAVLSALVPLVLSDQIFAHVCQTCSTTSSEVHAAATRPTAASGCVPRTGPQKLISPLPVTPSSSSPLIQRDVPEATSTSAIWRGLILFCWQKDSAALARYVQATAFHRKQLKAAWPKATSPPLAAHAYPPAARSAQSLSSNRLGLSEPSAHQPQQALCVIP